MKEPKLYWTSSCGRLTLELTVSQAKSASHTGRCDDDVAALSRVPEVAAQLSQWDADTLRAELKGYGAWDAEELADHAQNLQRALWLAAGDMVENPPDDWEDCGCCGGYHPAGYAGDCRNNDARLP